LRKRKRKKEKEKKQQQQWQCGGSHDFGLAAFGSTATHAACQKEKESWYLPT